MFTFQKVFIDDQGGYKIRYVPDIGRQKFIDESKPLYQEWLLDGNTPTEIQFVSPDPYIDTRTTREKVIDQLVSEYRIGEIVLALLENEAGDPTKLESIKNRAAEIKLEVS